MHNIFTTHYLVYVDSEEPTYCTEKIRVLKNGTVPANLMGEKTLILHNYLIWLIQICLFLKHHADRGKVAVVVCVT